MDSRVTKAAESIDNFMFGVSSLFDKIGFFNLGYWKGVGDSVELAQINLIETLVQFFPDRTGHILDVACGKGASSKFLTKYFDPAKIVGVNISERQLNICRAVAPECTFRIMDAANMDFADSSFDNVLCIEAALHFRTRERFFHEAARVLRRSGRLAMLDFVSDYRILESLGFDETSFPAENELPDLDAYRDKLLNAGFTYVRVDDVTNWTIEAASHYAARQYELKVAGEHAPAYIERIRRIREHRRSTKYGCLVFAIK